MSKRLIRISEKKSDKLIVRVKDKPKVRKAMPKPTHVHEDKTKYNRKRDSYVQL